MGFVDTRISNELSGRRGNVKLICVDDEQPALDNFQLTVRDFPEIASLKVFKDPETALQWVKENPVDGAFLDIELPGWRGLDLAREMCKIRPELRVVFLTAYHQYAMEAWDTDALGYVLKPYSAEDIRKQLDRMIRYRPMPGHRVEICTIPDLSITVDGDPLFLKREKGRELFALLVDRGEVGITTGEGIACLWPDRPNNQKTGTLFRMTYMRLVNDLREAGIGHILTSEGNRRAIRVDQVECDLYRILKGDAEAAKAYGGQYLREYSWAEERNGQLYRMLLGL